MPPIAIALWIALALAFGGLVGYGLGSNAHPAKTRGSLPCVRFYGSSTCHYGP